MYFLIDDEDLLESIILFRINSALKLRKKLIANLLTTTLKTKIKSYVDEDFRDKEMLNVGSDYTCLVVINIDSALKKNYYPQVLLKECKY